MLTCCAAWENTDNKSGTCHNTTSESSCTINNFHYTVKQYLSCVEKDDPGYCSNVTVSSTFKSIFGDIASPLIDVDAGGREGKPLLDI